MRTKKAEWFECKITFDKLGEDALLKRVSEKYVVEALSYTEAEKRLLEETEPFLSGELEVKDIKKAQYKEVFFVEDSVEETRFYRAKLQFILVDEKTEKEKRQNVVYLVQAASLHKALNNIDCVMKGTMIDYVQASMAETQIVDVFEYMKEETV